ncbi:MAG: substrate-binding domain-containing protein, partial [Phycisphaerae bacterium]
DEHFLDALAGHKPDAALGAMFSKPILDAVGAAGIPAVNVSGRDWSTLPSVIADNHAIGRVAAEHFLACGFERFAYVGGPALFSRERGEGFSARLEEAGLSCETRGDRADGWWLEIPPPLALFAENDGFAKRLVSECLRAGRAVPEEAAVLGVDNDSVACELSDVPLSSIDPAAGRIGYLAAELLEKLVEGGTVPEHPIRVSPVGVVHRPSTDVFVVDDPDLAAAMRVIAQRACEPITVEQVMEHVRISRRTFEKRFKARFAHTPHDEIRRVQFEQARRLLSETDWPIVQIAHRVGHSDAKRFITLFRKAFGDPPATYRRKLRSGSSGLARQHG